MAMATFSSALNVGIRLNCWNTKPISRERMSVSTLSDSSSSDRPSKRIWPEVGVSRAPSSCRSVVFPEPLGPPATPSRRARSPDQCAQRVDRDTSLGESAGHALQHIRGSPVERSRLSSFQDLGHGVRLSVGVSFSRGLGEQRRERVEPHANHLRHGDQTTEESSGERDHNREG